MVLCPVITTQNDKAFLNQTNISTITTIKPLILPRESHHLNSNESHLLNLTTTGITIANDISSEPALLHEEHTQVSNECKEESSQSNSKPSTEPTSKPMTSDLQV